MDEASLALLRGRGALRLDALGADTFGDQESKLERLIGVETRVAVRVITARKIGVRDRRGAARALGHVLSRELEMHAARVAAFAAMHREERLQFFEHAIE